MSRSGWRGEVGIEQSLLDEAHAFDFYQAVRLLEMRSRAALTDADARPADAVRFRASFDLSFPPSDIRHLRLADGGGPPEMTVSFLGTGGLDGPLPTSFTEEILERLSRSDTAVAAFLDIFHNRLVWLLYRIRKAHWAALATEAPEDTASARFLFSMMGLGLESVSAQLDSPSRLLRYTGLLAAHPRSAAGLVAMLSDYFGVPVQAEEFVGDWYAIEADQTTRIGRAGQNNVLGQSATVGTRVWIQDAGIRLRVGPLDAHEFPRFLPGGSDHTAMAELIRFYAGPEMQADVYLVVRPEDVTRAQLGGTRVGWTSWLKTMPAPTAGQVQVRVVARTDGETPA